MINRDNHIDNAKGILILLVVLGHLVYPVPSKAIAADALYIFIYMFHMPMFALLSGYLSHATFEKGRIVTEAKRFLVPYAMFMALQWGLLTALGQETYPVHEGHFGLWFLLSLFCWRLLLPIVVKTPYPMLVTAALAMGCGAIPVFDLDFSLSRTLTFMPFFLAGHLMRKNSISLSSVIRKPVAVCILAIFAGLSIYLVQWNVQAILYAAQPFDRYGMPNILGFATRGIWLASAFATGLAFLSLVPKSKGLFSHFGRNSLYIYLLHSPLLVLYRAWPDNYAFIGREPLVMIPLAVFVVWLLSTPVVLEGARWIVEPFSRK